MQGVREGLGNDVFASEILYDKHVHLRDMNKESFCLLSSCFSPLVII